MNEGWCTPHPFSSVLSKFKNDVENTSFKPNLYTYVILSVHFLHTMTYLGVSKLDVFAFSVLSVNCRLLLNLELNMCLAW